MSREAAAESSPGRKPGVTRVKKDSKPQRGDRLFDDQPQRTCRPVRGLTGYRIDVDPLTYARGYFLPPLRGSLTLSP